MSNRVPQKILHHILTTSFVIFLSNTLTTPNSHAREGNAEPVYVKIGNPQASIVEGFVRQGKKYYQQGDAQGAINHFARVLLRDPSHKTARGNMILISAWRSLSASQRIQLLLSEDLLISNEKLQKKLIFLTTQRDTLAASLIQGNYPPMMLIDQKFQAIQGRVLSPKDDQKEVAGPIDPLETLNRFLIREQNRLSQELSRVGEQIARLRPAGSLREEPQTPDTQASRLPKTDSHRETWQQIADVREELNELRRQVKALQEDVKHKDDKIMALTKQVVEFSLKLTEREMILSEKIGALGSLHEAYADLQSRQELGQRIMEEKNTQIQSLQEGLAALQADTAVHTKEINSLIAAKDQALDEWEKILAIYQGKLKDATKTIEVRNADVTTLEEQLAMVRTKLFEKETALEKTKEKLVSIEKQFQSVVSDMK